MPSYNRGVRASPDLYVEWVAGEAVALNRRTGEVHYLNPTAATVLALIHEHGYEGGVAHVLDRFRLDAGDAELQALLREMAASGILLGPDGSAPPAAGPVPGEPRAAAG